jgi:patatin-related protein
VSTDGQSDPTKELRLALVLYGGVSLAIYMHGITKELHKLVAASRALDLGVENPFPAATTEHVYWETLSRLRDAEGVRTRVVVDVIAGTSAGGINGVYLAKGLAQNVRQDELRNLWIENGDIAKLLRGSSRWPLKARITALLLQSLAHPDRNEPVLRGDIMSRWFAKALADMDEKTYVDGAGTLMPEGHALQLFVTATDFYGYDRKIPIGSPRVVTDLRHRHVFEFRRDRRKNQFTDVYNYGLAFVSRATSSFPGAFPAVSFADFERTFDPPISLGDFDKEFCRIYRLSGTSATHTYFLDGGVLNNFPFDHAIGGIRARRADVEVDRRLLYVQPDPRSPKDEPGQKDPPGWVPTVWGGMASIPSREPILDDLLQVMRLNERVDTIRQIIESSFGDVRERIEALLPKRSSLEALLTKEDTARLLAVRAKATEQANVDVGHGYATYVRMKIRSVVDDFAGLVNNLCNYPEESDHAFFVRAVVSAWAQEAGVFEKEGAPTTLQKDFLKQFDLEYTHRMLRFLIAAASWWYRDVGKDDTPTREQLGVMKKLLYDRLEKIVGITSGVDVEPQVAEAIGGIFDEQAIRAAITDAGADPAPFLDSHREELHGVRDALATFLEGELGDFTETLAEEVRAQTASWNAAPRADFFVRYLGFAFWDVLLFPVQLLAEAGERDAVEVVRVSPLDSFLLRPPDGGIGDKLKGTALHHFAAFFHRDFRENDYLWGRLDGAERLLTLLLAPTQLDGSGRCADAFAAILAEEAGYLKTAAPLADAVRAQLSAVRKLAAVAEERLEGQTPKLDPREDFAPELSRVIGEEVARLGTPAAGADLEAAQQRVRELLDAVLADTDEKSPRRRFARAGRPPPTT